MTARRLSPLVGVTLLLCLSPVGPAAASPVLEKAVTNKGIFTHLRAFQAIADANRGNRAVGTSGYRASANYVAKQLRGYGWEVERDRFGYSVFTESTASTLERTAPNPKTFANGPDFATGTWSGSGDLTAEVVAVDLILPPPSEPGSTSGCEAEDFADANVGGKVALIQRGTCLFRDKVANAIAAGAAAVVIFNEGQPDRTDVPPVDVEEAVSIPVLGASFAVGEELAAGISHGPTGATVHIRTDTKVEQRSSQNVLAELKGSRRGRVVIAGGHLDSVPVGPGINDNGSGVASLMEVARQITRKGIRPRHTLRFAFWGAEEIGLIGSRQYLAGLSDRARNAIALYLNFDMIASPNYMRIVSDGDGSEFPAELPLGSAAIEQTYQRYFSSRRLKTAQDRFVGSDDVNFIEAGIPAGFLYTGSSEIKTEEQQAIFGGTAGQALDPCYHQACDDISNINRRALREMSDAMAHAIARYASDLRGIPRRG